MALSPKFPEKLDPTSNHERHFYAVTRAFGRFGMRIFTPMIMQAPHRHGHVEMNFVTGATMTYEFDGETIEIPPNCLVIFWAGVPHQTIDISRIGEERPRLANIYIPVDTFLSMPHIAHLQVALLGGAIAVLPTHLIDMALLRRWYGDYRSNDFERFDTLKMDLNALLRRALFSELGYLRAPQADLGNDRVLISSNIRHVVEMVRFILENSADPLTNADVAAVTGLHPNYALSIFKQIMRVPPKRFVIRMRLLRARALLLESAMPITTVAETAGFTSISQFYEHFKQSYGISPHAMREKYKGTTSV